MADDEAILKKCSKCKTTKELSKFHRHKRYQDGRNTSCSICEKIYAIEYRKNNKKLIVRRAREYYIKNRGRILEKFRKFRQENLNSVRESYRDCYKEKRDTKLKNMREYSIANPGKVLARSKVQIAIKNGSLKRLSCEVCGNPRSHAHHDDYSKPLDVRFLCARHHGEVHREKL